MEAAFIGMMTCILVMTFFLFALYLLDLGTTDSYLREQAVWLSASGDKKRNSVEIKNELQKRLLICNIDKFQLVETGDRIYGEVKISVSCPIPVVDMWTSRTWRNQLAIALEKGNNQKKMRRWDQIE